MLLYILYTRKNSFCFFKKIYLFFCISDSVLKAWKRCIAGVPRLTFQFLPHIIQIETGKEVWIMKLRFRLALCALLILIVLPFAAQAGGTYTLNVGDTLTLYASTGGKAVTSYAWYSNDSASVHVLNPRSNPCQIEVVGPSTFSSGVIVQCDYSYIIQNGSFSYLASGMDSFHIYVNTPTPRPTVRPTPTPVRTPTPVPTATPVPTPTPTPRPANACGDNCRWSLSNGKLTITGTGAMFDYTASAQQPWAGQAITSVHIGEGVTPV